MRSLEARRVFGPGGVRQGGAQQFRLAEAVADRLLALLQNLGFAAGGQFLCHVMPC